MKHRPRSLLWGSAAAVYFVATSLGHLAFSLWLVSPRSTTWQGQTVQYSYRDAMPYLLPLAALGLLAWLVRDAMRHGTRLRLIVVASYWLLWAGCVAAVDRWLTFSVPEYFHYPQYALLAWLLAQTLDPKRSRWPVRRLLLLTTLLGAADELAQYLWITASYSHYYDFNDVFVNLLAAVLGVMVYYGFRAPPSPREATTSSLLTAICAACLLLVALAMVSGRIQHTPPTPLPPGGVALSTDALPTLFLQRQPGMYDRWHPGAWHPQHWVLGPSTGLALVILLGLAWQGFARLQALPNGSFRSTNDTKIPY